MLLIYGAYRFWPKRVAFRNDYCLTCRAPRRSIAVRTFDVGHIFWIPIFPVGFWKHWKCSQCGHDPHVSRKTRRSLKWAGLACLIVVSVIFWMSPVESDFALTWFFRVAAPTVAVLLLRHLLRTPSGPSLKQRLATILPATDVVCPFCQTPLVTGTSARWSCPACGGVRY